MSELLPCPFCGKEAEIRYHPSCHHDPKVRAWAVCCSCCSARVGSTIYATGKTKDEAMAAWNTRTERTCQNISEPKTGFLCSACGWGDFCEPSHLLTTACFKGGGILNYCPNCGARVVD